MLTTQWKWAYILNFGPWWWSALNVGFVDKWTSRMQGQCFFKSQAREHQFSVGFKKIWKFWASGCPYPNLPPQKSLLGGGDLTSPNFLYVFICLFFYIFFPLKICIKGYLIEVLEHAHELYFLIEGCIICVGDKLLKWLNQIQIQEDKHTKFYYLNN